MRRGRPPRAAPGGASWEMRGGCRSEGRARSALGGAAIRTPAQWDADMDQAPSILQTEKA